MTMRAIGGSGLETPPLILGGNVFGWTADENASFAVLDAFVAGGGRMIDTADIYSAWAPGNSGGESEAMIGKWLKRRGRRDDVLIATKVGMRADRDAFDLSPAHIVQACEASLRRLGTDTIDLYFAHQDDTAQPQEDVLAAFDRLVMAGKVRAIGASQYKAERLASALEISRANGLARFEALQPLYNLVSRGVFEGALQDLCGSEGIGVVPFYGLAAGFLTGKYRTSDDLAGRARSERVRPLLTPANLAVLDAMDAIAAESGATLPQIALAWLATRPSITAPIASATSVTQLEELLAALDLVLTPEQLERLDRASAPRNDAV